MCRRKRDRERLFWTVGRWKNEAIRRCKVRKVLERVVRRVGGPVKGSREGFGKVKEAYMRWRDNCAEWKNRLEKVRTGLDWGVEVLDWGVEVAKLVHVFAKPIFRALADGW